MLTWIQYHKAETTRIRAEYGCCKSDAILCADNRFEHWWDEVLDAARTGAAFPARFLNTLTPGRLIRLQHPEYEGCIPAGYVFPHCRQAS